MAKLAATRLMSVFALWTTVTIWAGGASGNAVVGPLRFADQLAKDSPVVIPQVSESVGRIESPVGSKSVPKAFLFSLLLPGAGQFYVQAPARGRLFVGAELAILAGFVGFHLHSDWKEEDYRLFAAAHAGVDLRDKSQSYFEDISLYMSMEDYNLQQLHDYREEAELYSGVDFWEWDNDRSRRKFDSLFRASTNAEDNAIIMTGLGLLNHLFSAVDAARIAKAFNRSQVAGPSPVQLTFRVKPRPGSSLVMVGLKKSF